MNETQSEALRLALRRFEVAAYRVRQEELRPAGGEDRQEETWRELTLAKEAVVSLVAGMLASVTK